MFKYSILKVVVCVSLLWGTQLLNAYGAISASLHKKTSPVHLMCNYRVNPIGIDDLEPNFSWRINTKENKWTQTAYQIIVSTRPDILSEKNYDIWNSGKISGNESVCIPYQGKELDGKKRYYWKVRVWDGNDKPSSWSKEAFWETGILNPSAWEGRWITNREVVQEKEEEKEKIKWIWLKDQGPTKVPRGTKATFRIELNIEERPQIAAIHTAVRGDYELFVNGILVDTKEKTWQTFERQDIVGFLKKGINKIDVNVSVTRTASFKQTNGRPLSGRYAVFGGMLEIEKKDGSKRLFPTSGGQWKSRIEGGESWEKSKVVGELTDPRFGLDPGPLSIPAVYFRKEFRLKGKVVSARLYATAYGSYRFYLNGERVGNDVLTPEFTNYNERLTYQVYDVTSLLKKGRNAAGAILGDGWYGSPLGWNGEYDIFDVSPNRLMSEIHVVYDNGIKEKIVTNSSWKTERSPILKSEIYSGEFYDARLEHKGWNTFRFNDKKWSYASEADGDYSQLVAQESPAVDIVKTVQPKEIRKIDDQKWIVDMGQNLVGWLKIKMKGEPGNVLRVRHAEILASPDSIYVDNLRNATSVDCYVQIGGEEEVFTPHFTFHGFRYAEITGYPGELTKGMIEAEVISSVENRTGFIETSDLLVNKMYELGIWGQLGNFISVPTDCPQRDERLGYTGDGQVFWRTGTYNFNIAAFTHKWMDDITDEQTKDGGFTNTAPAVPKSNRKNGAPGWEDAGVIVPWSSWMQYGDESIIRENWPAMVRYMDYVEERSTDYLRPGGFLGDWLAPDPSTPNDLISTGLWGMTVGMMAQMAAAIGQEADVVRYNELKNRIQGTFQQTFIADDGTVGSGSQTSYTIALHTGMVPDSLKELVADNLVKAIESRDWHVSTGFLGTPYLLFALSDNGRADVAYRLLLNETYPSWGYMIKNGATTWWERWNSDSSDPTMNSFNHYAFGSVVEWIYRSMAGINATIEAPGFKKIIIRPVFDPNGKIDHARGKYQSVYGEIVSEWQMNADNTVTLKVTIPANTTATIIKPQMAKNVENDDKVVDVEKIEVGSGIHEFVISLK
jgi:alpha-L-rhamnosidase